MKKPKKIEVIDTSDGLFQALGRLTPEQLVSMSLSMTKTTSSPYSAKEPDNEANEPTPDDEAKE